MWDFLSGPELASLGSVIVIDIVMSGDNAIIIGMAAAGLPPELRRRAICIGIAAATVLRVMFAAVTFHLLAIIGLTLAGGLLLLWVCWRMWRDIRGGQMSAPASEASDNPNETAAGAPKKVKTLRQAMIAIVVADVSMSLDNVLAVAGAARDNLWVLVFGLTLSIALMALASNYIAKLLERHHWIAYIGLAIVAYVAIDMISRGFVEVAEAAV
ncbi:MAG: TerC family protein [Alphaproteobacteria bacterium]